MTRYRTILDSPHVFAGILLMLAMSVLFDAGAPLDRAQARDLADRHAAAARAPQETRAAASAAAGALSDETASKE